MTNHFYELRHTQLTPKLSAQLAPFIIANRPFDGIQQTWQQMKKDGYTRIDHVSTGMDEINEDVTTINSITFDHDNQDKAFIPRPDIQGSDWLTAKVNHWKAQTAAKNPTQ